MITSPPAAASRRAAAALLLAAPLYWLRIFPVATREMRKWHARAEGVPDPTLRRHALAKLAEEGVSAEGAAAFAILASRRCRHGVIRACVAFEVLYDYLDALTEDHPAIDNNRRLHRALSDAVSLSSCSEADYYRHHPQSDDGGYLRDLVAACRREFARLPSSRVASQPLLHITAQAGEAQSLNHVGVRRGHRALEAWAALRAGDHPDLHWFEFAAGAGSPLGVFALLAAASHESTDEGAAAAISAAYFPWIAALHWLLESLVDRTDDARTGNHSYIGRYGADAQAIARMTTIARRAASDVGDLPRSSRHLLLLAGMIAMNLVRDDADDNLSHGAANAVRAAVGPLVSPFLAMLRLRRGAKALRRRARLLVPALRCRR